MPAPPPPPPPPPGPPPPPPPTAALPQCPPEPPQLQFGGGGGRNALLADIQKGAKLRKVTQVNDRSAPAVDKPKTNAGDVGASQSSSAGMAPTGPSLGGLFAGGFPTLRPTGHRDIAGKTPVSRSSSAASLKPQWNTPLSSDSGSLPESPKAAEIQNSFQRVLTSSASAPPSPSHSSKHPPAFPVSSPPTPPPAPPSVPPPPPPPQVFQERLANKAPSLPSCPPPPPPSQITRPTWLPVQHSHHTSLSQPSTPPPPPPPLTHPPPSSAPGDCSSGFFYSPPPTSACSEASRFPVLRDSPLGPPPPPPPPPLPTPFTPSCPTTLPPPPPRTAPVPSPAMRSLPPSYPCNVPTRRPPAVPRSLGVGRLLAPPPAPPARSPTTELSTRILPPPPPPPPFSFRNGHLQSLVDDFESKFQFHPVEDLPPPDEFKPFPRVYPSKENRVNPKPPGIRTHLR